jgi:hypothetical protein
MLKRSMMIIFLLSFACITAFADNCPSVQAIHQHKLAGWKLYDVDDNKPLTAKRADAFKKDVKAFAMVEWSKDPKSKGMIQCFYRDKDGSDLEAYLAKDHFNVGVNQSYWYNISGHLQCAAQAKTCEFQTAPIMQAQLAKN